MDVGNLNLNMTPQEMAQLTQEVNSFNKTVTGATGGLPVRSSARMIS